MIPGTSLHELIEEMAPILTTKSLREICWYDLAHEVPALEGRTPLLDMIDGRLYVQQVISILEHERTSEGQSCLALYIRCVAYWVNGTKGEHLTTLANRIDTFLTSSPLPKPTPVRSNPTPQHQLNYSHGLQRLRLLLDADDEQLALFATFEERLLRNLTDEYRFGPSDTLRSERSRVIYDLNTLALGVIKRSFTELCR